MLTIDGFVIDAGVSETPEFDLDVTDHPVETGASITDHSLVRPVILSIEGIITDTPIGLIAESREESGVLPTNDGFQKLLDIKDAREPVTIVTSLKTFKNMVMQSLTVPRDASTGDALIFRATFKQIRLVTNARTTIPVLVPRAKKKINRGNKASAAVPEAAQPPSGKTTEGLRSIGTGLVGGPIFP
jgi:hypothetical protein